MEWLLILQLLNPAAETSSVITQSFESRDACKRHISDIGQALGVKNGSKTLNGSEVMLQCVAKVAKA